MKKGIRSVYLCSCDNTTSAKKIYEGHPQFNEKLLAHFPVQENKIHPFQFQES
jgi:hypothetical protein